MQSPEKKTDVCWFEPFHRPADDVIIWDLQRRMAATVAFRDLKKRLKPDSEEKAFKDLSQDPLCSPDAIRELIPKISVCTETERKLIFDCLQLFPDSLQIKDIGAVNSATTKQKKSNTGCVPIHVQCKLDEVQESMTETFQRGARRERELEAARKSMQELFIKKLCDIRAEEKNLNSQNLRKHMQATTHSQRREKEARQMAQLHNRIGLELQQNRTFYSFWKHEDGTPMESFHRMQEKYSNRKLKVFRWVDPAKREAKLSDEAEEFATRKMLEGKDLIFDDREFQAKLDKGDSQTRPGFSFRDEPDRVSLSDINCSLDMIRKRYSERYRKNLEKTSEKS